MEKVKLREPEYMNKFRYADDILLFAHNKTEIMESILKRIEVTKDNNDDDATIRLWQRLRLLLGRIVKVKKENRTLGEYGFAWAVFGKLSFMYRIFDQCMLIVYTE